MNLETGARGFTYPLEPALRKRQWELDATQRVVARLRAEIACGKQKQSSLQARLEAQLIRATRAWAVRSDPGAQRAQLAYLASLRAEHAELEDGIASLEARLTEAVSAMTARHQQLEALERHRSEALSAHHAASVRKEQSQADEDWQLRVREGGS